MPGLGQVCRCPAASQRLALPCACPTLRQPGTAGDERGKGVEQHGRTREAWASLPLCSRHRDRGGRPQPQPSRAPTTDHPPTSTTTRLHREPPRPSPPGACSPSAPHIKSAAISHGEHGLHRPAAGPALVNTNICRLIQTSLASPFPPSPALLLQLSWALCCFCSWPLSVLSFSCCNGYLRLQSHSFKLLSLLSPCSSHPFRQLSITWTIRLTATTTRFDSVPRRAPGTL